MSLRSGPAPAARANTSWLPLVVVVLTQIQASFAVNTLTVSMQGITTDLNTAATSVGTAITAGTFAMAAFILLGAKIGAKYGSRRVFQIAVAIHGAAMAAVALSVSPAMLFVAQAASGAVIALIAPALVVFIATSFQGEQQAKAIGFLAAAIPAAGVLALLIAGCGVAVVAIAWRGGSWRRGGERLAARLATIVAALLVLLAAVGATRPLWLISHQYIGPSFSGWIHYWQAQERLAFDDTRSYAENTLTWLSWYDSAIVVAAGVIGIALLVRRFGRTGRPAVVGFLLIFLSYSLASLTYPDITADQIWSIRRFLPIVIPGFLIGAAYLSRMLSRHGRAAQAGVGVLCLAALGLVLRTDQPLARIREGVPQLAEIENVCANLPAHAAVVVGGGMWFGYSMTVRSYCQVPVAGLPSSADPRNPHPLVAAELAEMRSNAAAAGRSLVLLTDDPASLPTGPDGNLPHVAQLSHIVSNRWKPALVHAARDPWPNPHTVYLLTVGPDGTVSTPAGQHTLVATG